MAWLSDDFNPGPAHLAIRWYRGPDWSEGVESWFVPGPRSIDLADGSLAEHGWRRMTDWHPIELGHTAIVERDGGDDDEGLSDILAIRTRNGQQPTHVSLSAAR